MKNMYLYVEVGGGIDYHDYSRHYEQMKYDGNYQIPSDKLNDVIFAHMLETVLVPDESVEPLRKALEEKKEFTCPIYANAEAKEKNELEVWEEDDMKISEASINLKFSDNEIVLYYEYMFGQYTGEAFYWSYEIESGDEVYTVVKEYLCPMKGCPSLDRLLHMPFASLEEAEKYLAVMTEKLASSSEANAWPRRNFVLKIGKTEMVKDNLWYKDNLKAMTMMFELGITDTDENFHLHPTYAIEQMQSSYDSLIAGRSAEMIAATCKVAENVIPTLSVGDKIWTEGVHVDELGVRYVKAYSDASRNNLLGWIKESNIQYC